MVFRIIVPRHPPLPRGIIPEPSPFISSVPVGEQKTITAFGFQERECRKVAFHPRYQIPAGDPRKMGRSEENENILLRAGNSMRKDVAGLITRHNIL
jgi:hypothetical protein